MTPRQNDTILGLRQRIQAFLAQHAAAADGADPQPLSDERKDKIVQAALRRYQEEEGNADDFWESFWKGVLVLLVAFPAAVWGFLTRLRSPLPLDHPVTLSCTLTLLVGGAAACASSVSAALTTPGDPLADRDLDRRLRAVAGLETSADPERNANLRRALEDGDLRVRRRAAEAVGRLRLDERRAFLVELDVLRIHPDAAIRAQALRAWQMLASYYVLPRGASGDAKAAPLAHLLGFERNIPFFVKTANEGTRADVLPYSNVSAECYARQTAVQ